MLRTKLRSRAVADAGASAMVVIVVFLALAEVSGSLRSTAFEAKKRPAPKSGAREAVDEYAR